MEHCGVDQVGCKNGLLMNNNLSATGLPNADVCFQAKGGSYNIGVYKNTFTNAGVQALNMGQQTGAGAFWQGNIGWEGYDQVAMGNKF